MNTKLLLSAITVLLLLGLLALLGSAVARAEGRSNETPTYTSSMGSSRTTTPGSFTDHTFTTFGTSGSFTPEATVFDDTFHGPTGSFQKFADTRTVG